MIWCLHVFVVAQTMKQLLVSLKISYIEVETVNTLRSWSNGFLVSVYGIFKSVDVHGPRQFVQTFFLAPQMNGYFVQNEIFHFAGSCQSHVPVADERSVNQQPTASSCPPGAQGIVDWSADILNMLHFLVKLNMIIRVRS